MKNRYGKLKIKSNTILYITIDLKLNSLKKEMSGSWKLKRKYNFNFFENAAKIFKIKYNVQDG